MPSPQSKRIISPSRSTATEGSDTITGTAADEFLCGVPVSTSLYGRNSIDTLTGGAGNDVFIVGAAGRVYYDDGNAKSTGTKDYALITDFTAGADKLQVASGVAHFNIDATLNGQTGRAVYADSNRSGAFEAKADEMIAFLVGAGILTDSDFTIS